MAMILLKSPSKRKAISSVVTAAILIVLTITAAAIVYFVIIPLLQREGELVILDYNIKDTNDTDLANELNITISNIGKATVTINDVQVTSDGNVVNWDLYKAEYIIEPDEEISIIIIATSIFEEFSYGDFVSFNIPYEEKAIILEFRVSAKFSHYTFLYEEDFENFTSADWSLFIFQTHAPIGTESIDDWIIEDEKGNHFWRCTTNNCQFIVLNNPLYNFTNVNISYDLQTDDQDANGIIFRYDDSGLYPKFYIIWFTEDHPSPRNGPHIGELDYFDWDTVEDQIEPNKITVHYVEGDAEGFNWYKITEEDWIRNYDQWYTWRVVANESNVDLFIDNFDVPFLSFSDDRISYGHIGLISFANLNSYYDNIYVW